MPSCQDYEEQKNIFAELLVAGEHFPATKGYIDNDGRVACRWLGIGFLKFAFGTTDVSGPSTFRWAALQYSLGKTTPGKTSFLDALFAAIGSGQRVITEGRDLYWRWRNERATGSRS